MDTIKFNSRIMDPTVYKRAKTTKEISGLRVKTIPVGTTILVVANPHLNIGYVGCKGIDGPLGITSIWLDEFEIID